MTSRDAATKKLSDAKLLESERRLRAVLETAVDAIITINDRGIVESFNPAAERMFAYEASEVIGQNVSMLMPSPDREQHDSYLSNYQETGERKIIGIGREVEARRKDGTVFPISLAVSELELPERRLFTGIIRDITELRKARASLVQSERLAAMGQMLSGIAHESRNALQRIQASVDMLSIEIPPDSEAAGDVAKIARAREDLQRLFEELRNYAAPIHLELSQCRLSAIWQQAWSHLEPLTKSRDAKMIVQCDDVDRKCKVDAFRLEQVFRNLMENALAAAEDPVEIRVACHECLQHGSPAISILVSDNGPGLSEEQESRIFEAFYTTKTKGTGLGMAIARRIVEAHGGSIRIQQQAIGACFEIILPQQGAKDGA